MMETTTTWIIHFENHLTGEREAVQCFAYDEAEAIEKYKRSKYGQFEIDYIEQED